MGFLIRWISAFILLALTFNPTDFNYVRWAQEAWSTSTPMVVLAGLVLLVAYVLFLTAVFRGIGTMGVFLILAVFAALIWVLVDMGWISLDNPGVLTWVGLLAMSVVLAIGMYWGIFWRRLSGQLEVDDNVEG
ncbi:MAG: DUF6524 family protein [Boseongicola sp.]|nr:DUF6524 family protein [Boseongicola sp.]MDD9978880.1 DUF6524 family protein [Boseongicola sp.]